MYRVDLCRLGLFYSAAVPVDLCVEQVDRLIFFVHTSSGGLFMTIVKFVSLSFQITHQHTKVFQPNPIFAQRSHTLDNQCTNITCLNQTRDLSPWGHANTHA